MTHQERSSILDRLWNSFPPFNLEAAKSGQTYLHRFDFLRYLTNNQQPPTYCDCREITAPHASVIVWCEEWISMGPDEMTAFLRMWDASAWEQAVAEYASRGASGTGGM